MAPNDARENYISGREKPTEAEIRSMTLVGGRAAMRTMMEAGGDWNKQDLIATPVHRLDKYANITGTYWMLQGSPKIVCISARDIWPECTDTKMSVVIELGCLSTYEFGDMSTTSTWVTSQSIDEKIKYVTGNVKRQITPQQAGEFGVGTFFFRFHLLPEAKDELRVWISVLPGSKDTMSERLKPLMGKNTFPSLSYELMHRTIKNVKGATLKPKASNQKMGVFPLAMVDGTMVENVENVPPKVDPTSYVEGIRGLCAKGVWPNKCSGAALQDKLELYVGDMALYSPANRKRISYYATSAPQEEVATAGKPKMTCIPGGKYREVHALGIGAMTNSSLPESVTAEAYKLVSMSISVNTAKTYRSAQSILGPASAWLGRPIEIPFTDSDTIALVVYMAVVRSLRSTSIGVYFAGFRMLHLMKGSSAPNLRTDLVNQMITGVKNGNHAADVLSDRRSRQPVTFKIMSKLQLAIKTSRMDLRRKRLVWFAATSCLLGSFRIHEVLPERRHTYDKTTTLMAEDVKKVVTTHEGDTTKTLSYHIKNPKENKTPQGIKVDIFENTGSLNWLCAVKAYEKYQLVSNGANPNQPLFTLQDGSGYTGAMFNEDVKTLLSGKIDTSLGPLTTHSFRAGLATMMAEAGCTDDQIQLAGRWSSDAFKLYVKTARPRRAIMAASIWNRLKTTMALTNRH